MKEQKRFGVFLFATTRKHAEEIYSHLPKNQSAIILGDTPQKKRESILNKARIGEIKYLVNISIISVGVDIPAYDTIAYLRPTESLVLLIQTIGRALRLSPSTNKNEALILDFAGNIERHKDWDNPLLKKAISETIDKDKPLVIQCPRCNEMNTEHSRRCMGVSNEKRCEYFFEFKLCPSCNIKNDISSRHCRECKEEIIDPNKKLNFESIKSLSKEVEVITSTYTIIETQNGFKLNCRYQCKGNDGKIISIYENYFPSSEKAKYFFYGNFVKQHCKKSSDWLIHLQNKNKVEELIKEAEFPIKLLIQSNGNKVLIKKRFFN